MPGSTASSWLEGAGAGVKKSWLRKASGSPGSPCMFFGEAKVRLLAADAWQFMQYWAKPMFGRLLSAGMGGQSGAQPLWLPKPYQPQNQPSCDAPASRIMIAAPLVGNSFSGSTSRQAEDGVGYISLTMIAPSGTAGGVAGPLPSAGRYLRSHSTISGEYQITTGAWVPWPTPCQAPLAKVAVKGPASRTYLSRTQPAAASR